MVVHLDGFEPPTSRLSSARSYLAELKVQIGRRHRMISRHLLLFAAGALGLSYQALKWCIVTTGVEPAVTTKALAAAGAP